MVEIQEHKRDDSAAHLTVLKALNEIPFPVGKNLLAEFLVGKYTNKSVKKNKMDEMFNFGMLDFLGKNEVIGIIQNLIANGLIDVSRAMFNKHIKVLSISEKGKKELLNPTLNKKKISETHAHSETIIGKREKELFEKYNEFLTGFNEEQKKAIVEEKNRILTIAGAGSGKTSVLTKRIEHIVKNKKIQGEILAITFTRKARTQMKERLEEVGIKNLFVETFNSFCEKILQKNYQIIYGKPVRLADYKDKINALMMALEKNNYKLEEAINKYFTDNQKENRTGQQLQNIFMNDCFSVLDYFKSRNKTLEELHENSLQKTKDKEVVKMVSLIVETLDEYMKENNLRTYNDQIKDTIEFFKKNPEKIPKFEHILVDEYQDVNSQQVEFLDLLNPKNIFCVGDPRQSIFGWRGSDVRYILKFKKKYPDSEIISLKKNYRSHENIVELMNKSIEKMKLPELETGKKNLEENTMEITGFNDEIEEMNYIAQKILQSPVPRNEIFVLSRTNRQINDLSRILAKAGIPHILKTDDTSQKNQEVKEGYVTLSTIHSIKGLEAKKIFIMGCHSSNFPCKASNNPILDLIEIHDYDKEEEERRLFYVAISRAKNHLYLTYSGKNRTYFINEEMVKFIEKGN